MRAEARTSGAYLGKNGDHCRKGEDYTHRPTQDKKGTIPRDVTTTGGKKPQRKNKATIVPREHGCKKRLERRKKRKRGPAPW